MIWYNKQCVICGKEYRTYKSNKRVCSSECRKEYNRRYMVQVMRKRRIDGKIIFERNCVVCGKLFKTAKIAVPEVKCFDCRANERRIFVSTLEATLTPKID